jgi:hypothetical protein
MPLEFSFVRSGVRMHKLHMKVTKTAVEVQEMAGKTLNGWELDATGKVRNYSAQFQARYAQLKENSLAVI